MSQIRAMRHCRKNFPYFIVAFGGCFMLLMNCSKFLKLPENMREIVQVTAAIAVLVCRGDVDYIYPPLLC